MSVVSQQAEKKQYPVVLVVAASDSIAGAGIQADVKTAASLGVYAVTAVTAVTAQNTIGIAVVHEVPASVLEAQLEAVLSDVRPAAVKIGVVPSAEAAKVVGDAIRRYGLRNVILDPVCASTSGTRFAGSGTLEAIIDHILPHTDLITPNIPEEEILSCVCASAKGRGLYSVYGNGMVLLKGGHGKGEVLEDVLKKVSGGSITHETVFEHPRVATVNTHGTGCTLSSAIASYVALGCDMEKAVGAGCRYVQHAIESGAEYAFGHGHGPLNHFFLNSNNYGDYSER